METSISFKHLLGPEWNFWTEEHTASPHSFGRPRHNLTQGHEL